MTKESLKKEIDIILKKRHIPTNDNYVFEDKIKLYELITVIENKTGLLTNAEKIFEKDRVTYNDLVDIFYDEYERDMRGY